MSRIIKFRAWDINKKIMHQISDLTIRKDWIGCNAINIEADKIGDSIGINYFDKRHDNSFELMQFTGLQDKNGKELYQKDIVKYISQNDGETIFISSIEADLLNGIQINDASLRFEFSSYGDCLSNGNFEIIGNIYEHSHLINKN